MASETPDLVSAARAVMVDGARLVRDSASAAVVMFVLRGLAMRMERIEAMAAEQLAEHERRVRESVKAQSEAERAKRDAEKRAAHQQGQAESVLSTLEETRAAIDEATGSAPRSAYAIKLAIDRVKEGAAREVTKAWCEALEPVTEALGVERPGGLAAVERIRSVVGRLAARADEERLDMLDSVLVALGVDVEAAEDEVLDAVRELVDDQRKLREMIRVLSSEIEFVERHEPHVLVETLIATVRGALNAQPGKRLSMAALEARERIDAMSTYDERVGQAIRILGPGSGATGDAQLIDVARRCANERQQASAQAARAAVAIQDALLAAGVASDRADLPKALDDLTAMLPRLSGPTVEP